MACHHVYRDLDTVCSETLRHLSETGRTAHLSGYDGTDRLDWPFFSLSYYIQSKYIPIYLSM